MQTTRLSSLIFRRSVMRRAAIIAAVVGVVLAVINHGDRMLGGLMTPTEWMKVLLTFLVPYTVSTVSSAMAIRDQERAIAQLLKEQAR